MGSPVSSLTRARNSAPLAARRQASVAMARSARTGRRASRAAQPRSAAIARSIAVWLRRPVWCSPSPRRTMRLKLSSTRKPSPRAGVPTSMRQLLVPRSSAANADRHGRSARANGRTGSSVGSGAAWFVIPSLSPLHPVTSKREARLTAFSSGGDAGGPVAGQEAGAVAAERVEAWRCLVAVGRARRRLPPTGRWCGALGPPMTGAISDDDFVGRLRYA